jgi:phosphoglycerate dehydrogenase-like enzyme
MRIAILDDVHNAYEGTPGVARLRERAEVKIFTAPFTDASEIGGFTALIANRERTKFSRELLEQLPVLKIIVQTGNHAYHIDLDAADRLGVVVGKATGGCTAAAELALGLMIAVMRQIPSTDRAVRDGRWPTPMTRTLRGKTLGIIGLGITGRHLSKLANAFEMKVLAWSPRMTEAMAGMCGATYCDLDVLMQASDVVSIHATLNDKSRGLIDARRLSLMKPTAYIINTARGAIVDEPALVSALTDQRIAGAGLDVFAHEPLPAGHPLTKLENVVLTPHLGWPTDEMYAKFAEVAANVLLAYLDGKNFPRFTCET